jgi:hypothetical protein
MFFTSHVHYETDKVKRTDRGLAGVPSPMPKLVFESIVYSSVIMSLFGKDMYRTKARSSQCGPGRVRLLSTINTKGMIWVCDFKKCDLEIVIFFKKICDLKKWFLKT